MAVTEDMEPTDIKGLAQRCGVHERDVKLAIKCGQLVLGEHFILIGKKVCFFWGPTLIQKLFQSARQSAFTTPDSSAFRPPVAEKTTATTPRGVNMAYFNRKKR